MADIKQGFPDLFPTNGLRVEEESHTYNIYQEDTSTQAQDSYLLNKAPIKEIEEVSGSYNNNEIKFTKGVDYKLNQSSTNIVWIDGKRPDDGTNFYVTYLSDSVLERYISQGEEELERVEQELQKIKDGKFVETASGNQLDRLGTIFGTIGQRRGRDDQEYRIFLKSITRSFVSKGTKNDIKTAIAAATDVPLSDIFINEKVEDNEYEVVILAATPVTGSLIEDIADIADPSGVSLFVTRFSIFPDEMSTDDSTAFSIGNSVIDAVSANDFVDTNNNKFLISQEDSISTDTTTTNTNKNTIPETISANDDVTTEKTGTTWGSEDWGTLKWTKQ